MAGKGRTAAVLETARERLAGLKQISSNPDFGGNLNAAGGHALVTDLNDELDGYITWTTRPSCCPIRDKDQRGIFIAVGA